MSTEILAPLGPLLGPNVITVNVNDDTGRYYQLEVYPDANNPQLQAAGVATHFYFMPKQVYLARKATEPADFAFGMTVFKGLATTESTIGVTDAMAADGAVEGGGGFCEFSTTFAIPENVIQKAIQQLKAEGRPARPGAQPRDGDAHRERCHDRRPAEYSRGARPVPVHLQRAGDGQREHRGVGDQHLPRRAQRVRSRGGRRRTEGRPPAVQGHV